MILVVTLNPALDVTHEVDQVNWAGVNRPHRVHVRPGGKGVNVARTLRALGAEVTLAGLVGGGVGRELVTGLDGSGISTALTWVCGETRRTFAVVDTGRGDTAVFNEPGPPVSVGEYREFFVTYERALASCAAVVLSGSLPPGVPADAYADLIAAAAQASVPAILDASGAALAHGVAAGPALVKPNLAELGEVSDQSMERAGQPDADAVVTAAGRLLGRSAGGGRVAWLARAARDHAGRELAGQPGWTGSWQPDWRRRRGGGGARPRAGPAAGLAGAAAACGSARGGDRRGVGSGRVRCRGLPAPAGRSPGHRAAGT